MICVYGPKVPIHAKMIAAHLGAKVVTEFQPCDWMVFVYIDGDVYGVLEQCAREGVKTFGYWIGNDARFAFQETMIHKRVPTFNVNAVVHQRIYPELLAIGIEPEVVYFPVREELELSQLAGDPICAVYMPTTSRKYCFRECVEVAAACQDMHFIFYGSDNLPELPDNCFDAGRMSPEEVTSCIRSSTALLRFTEHDGCPQNISEAKMMGKHVVCNYPYFGCLYAENVRDAIRLLSDPMTHEGDRGAFRDWYLKHCAPTAFREKMFYLMDRKGNA